MKDKLNYYDYVDYNPEIHFNRGKPWTMQDMQMVLEKKYSDADLSVYLGRTVKSISQARANYNRENGLKG